MSTIPTEKDYRNRSVVYLDKQDIEDISQKMHPMQKWHVEQHEDLTLDDCFALPLPYLRGFDNAFLSYDKTGIHGKGHASATLAISQNDPWFFCHFVGDPVMPGSQGQDIIFQLAALWATARCEMTGRPRALEGNFNFHGQILPTSKSVHYRVDIVRSLKKKNLLLFEGTIAVDSVENVIYEFSDCKIGFFTREELGIMQPAKEYYKPDWEQIKQSLSHSVDQSKDYYDRT
ncbi:MAG: hypothetical protein KF744_12085 [Taibaiella sp.]|nr:hypothetical protein [Taibaiella sp.]